VGYDEVFNNIPANMGLNALIAHHQSDRRRHPAGEISVGHRVQPERAARLELRQAGSRDSHQRPRQFQRQDPNLRNAYIYQYNFGISANSAMNFSIEADYQGSSGHKLLLNIDLNEPYVTVTDPTKTAGGRLIPRLGWVGDGDVWLVEVYVQQQLVTARAW